MQLPASGGSVVLRTIDFTGRPCLTVGASRDATLRSVAGHESALRDAVGPYPLFACRDWDRLGDDLAAFEGAVSVVLVTDPLSSPPEDVLRAAFPHVARPYKLHYVADLSRPEAERISDHHRRRLRKVPPDVMVERIAPPDAAADEWTSIYDHLVRRREVRGVARFSRESFGRMLRVPGCSAYRAVRGGVTLGMALWYRDGADAWYHLGASTPAGYDAGSAYVIFRRALADLAEEGATRADLGGAAGLVDDPSDGLARFKRGWSTGTAVAWLCGRILDPDAYDRLARERPDPTGSYFPAYRAQDVVAPPPAPADPAAAHRAPGAAP